MKLCALMAGFLAATALAVPSASDDPLLDAKLDLALLRLRYTDQNPKMIEARERLDILSRDAPEQTPEQYLAHVRERLKEARVEDELLSTRYTENHPKRIRIAEKLKFLQAELQKALAAAAK